LSDDKGVEPEGVTLGVVGRKPVVFVGMERADAVAIYDISNPYHPVLLNCCIVAMHRKTSPSFLHSKARWAKVC
jgi:hypothetical protein